MFTSHNTIKTLHSTFINLSSLVTLICTMTLLAFPDLYIYVHKVATNVCSRHAKPLQTIKLQGSIFIFDIIISMMSLAYPYTPAHSTQHRQPMMWLCQVYNFFFKHKTYSLGKWGGSAVNNYFGNIIEKPRSFLFFCQFVSQHLEFLNEIWELKQRNTMSFFIMRIFLYVKINMLLNPH